MTIEEVLNRDLEFRYMLLGRLEQDCKYYLGNGARHPKHLWASEGVEEHINYMKAIHNSFPEGMKPEWLSMEEIESFEQEMK
jgi:hypothetical protein